MALHGDGGERLPRAAHRRQRSRSRSLLPHRQRRPGARGGARPRRGDGLDARQLSGAPMTRIGGWILAAAALAVLVGCSDSSKAKLPGERLSVLLFDPTLKPDPTVSDEHVAL